MREVRFRSLWIITLCVFGLIIGTLFGTPLLRPILESIKVLSNMASQIEKGNYDNEIKLESSDEIGNLARAFENMRKALKQNIEKLNKALLSEKMAHLDSVKALFEAVAVREPHKKAEIERVAKYAELIARELGLSVYEVERIEYGSRLRDIGKLGIDANLINKSSKLSPSEYEVIKKHPDLGAQIIKGIKFLEEARDIILYHHERYDGKGYPKGLEGEDIPIAARIVSLVDAYHAMASERPFEKKLNEKEITERIKKESGKQFDPKVVEAFLKIKRVSDEA